MGFMLRATTRKERPVAATTEAASTVIQIQTFAWGAVKFTVDPGLVTVYARMDEDDTFAAAYAEDGTPLTFSPGTSPRQLPADAFAFYEIKLVCANDITGTAGACRVTLKT